jgi:hypothetical protein
MQDEERQEQTPEPQEPQQGAEPKKAAEFKPKPAAPSESEILEAAMPPPGPKEFREGFTGDEPEDYQPPFPGGKPSNAKQKLEPAQPPEEKPQD